MIRRALYRLFTLLARLCVKPGDHSTDAETFLMTVIADFQTQLDRLAALPAKIAADKAAAVTAAEAQHTQDVADTVAAVTSAVDAVDAAA
jgi:hypothetical protein